MATEHLNPPLEAPSLEIQLSRVALVTDSELLWYPEESALYFDVHARDPQGPFIGTTCIDYRYDRRIARPHIGLQVQRQGIATEIYTAIPFMPLPGGESFQNEGFRLETNGHSYAANRLWKSLVRKGLAKQLDGSMCYEMLNSIPKPPQLEITKTGLIPNFIDTDVAQDI